ncbi:metal-dependent hydrolase [Acinetobacter sp. WCHAc060025]|uniref:HD domain-containing protein n=1 Tax=Acinetobacter sp. WCHAc060025 TaxID=2518625 RepID=UPI0010230970|nr:metal-dependent hydrolase [Acinetobacter sp. WCHAc060025]RZG75698.1 metal-dependent hydrolase [Acinetobacter sp. WCHAc060025]
MQNFTDQFLQYWAQFSAELNIPKNQSESLFSILSFSYSQNYYHTHQHIIECLELFHQIKDRLEDPIAIELAIWFHDVVYNPQASDNEEQSTKLMQKHCVGILKKEKLEKVAQWIIATKKHQPSKDHDLNYLLDIDLAILGSSPQRFAEYEQQIQQEYSWVESEMYKIKRAEVLKHFYQMKPLYQTEYFRDLLEEHAKRNLSLIG